MGGMNLTEQQLRAEYLRARAYAGTLIDQVEETQGIPARLMYAVGSRETHFLPQYLDQPGDGGHGHGWWQVDDRSHVIPADWAGNIAWQATRGAEILRACLLTENGDVVRAANRYNSGQPYTAGTTGKDYGPDVYDRWQALLRMYPPTPPAPKDPLDLRGRTALAFLGESR